MPQMESTQMPEFGDAYVRMRQLHLIRNFLGGGQAKTTDDTFEFILSHLPPSEIQDEIVERYAYDAHDDDSLGCDDLPSRLARDWNRAHSLPVFRGTLLHLIDRGIAQLEDQSDESPFRYRLTELCQLFRLNDEAATCLEAAHFFTSSPEFGNAVDAHMHRASSRTIHLVRLLGPTGVSCNRMLAIMRHLRSLGIMDTDCDPEPHVSDFLSGLSNDPLSASFFGRGTGPVLPLSAFDGMASEIGFLCDLIRNHAFDQPLHVLFYGCAGTGKTALARTLADATGNDLYEVKQRQQDAHRRSRPSNGAGFRMSAITACRHAMDSCPGVMLIDEADDLLNDAKGFGDDSRKGLVNDLIDHTNQVCIWITNHSEYIDDSTRRRFDYSLEFRDLSLAQRRTVWRHCLRRAGLKGQLTRAELGELVRGYRVNAGAIDFAVRNAARNRTGVRLKTTLERFLDQHVKLMHNGQDRKQRAVTRKYTLQGLNIRGDISVRDCVQLLGRFQRSNQEHTDDPDQPRNMNLLMYGPPGTGKTEFAHYLAQRLHCELMIKSASDILNCFVGNTEKNIRRAFEQAEREEALLFFDEIDGLLGDRTHANQSWEVTQVNELLTCVENFRGVFLAATNFHQRVDSASLRRFNLKLQFDYLDRDGRRVFWRRYLKQLTGKRLSRGNARELDRLSTLTPGDFKVVQQKYSLFPDRELTNAVLIEALAEEVHHKQKGAADAIGFDC